MNKHITISLLSILILAACGAAPQSKVEVPSKPAAQTNDNAYLTGDGPGVDAPANLDSIPDARLSNEPLHPYANRPYTALGKSYTPLTQVGNLKQRGMASWYGKKFHGQRTSSGEIYDMYAMSAAHPTLPIPSYARVTNLANQKSVVVRINDRGPFLHERVIDLSYTAAYKLGMTNIGSAEVEVESLTPDAIITPIAASEPVQSKPLEASSPATSVPAPPAISLPAPPATAPSVALAPLENNNVYLQLGAFKSQESAESFLEKMRTELSSTGKQLKLSAKGGMVRVHIGPYASQSEARSSAESMESKLGFKPMVNLP